MAKSTHFRSFKDPFSTAKLQIFVTIPNLNVLTPFLKKVRRRIIHNFVNTFGESVLDEATIAAKLSKIDVLNKKNTLPPKKADTGFACKITLQEAEAKKFASPSLVLEFQNECIVLLQQLECCLLIEV